MKKNIYILLLVLVILITGASVITFAGVEEHSSLSFQLSIKDAVQMALKHSEDIEIAEKQILSTEYEYKRIRGSAFPQLTASATWTRYLKAPVMKMDLTDMMTALNTQVGAAMLAGLTPVYQAMGIAVPDASALSSATSSGASSTSTIIETKLKKDNEVKLGAQLTQVLWSFGKVSNAIELAKKAISVEETSLKASKRETSYNTKVLYYSALLANQSLIIAKESYNNAVKNRDALRERYKYGRPTRSDNLRMDVDVAARVPMVMNTENMLQIATNRLKTWIGLNANEEIELTDQFIKDFPGYYEKTLIDEMRNNFPTLKMLKDSVEIRGHLANIEKANHLPTLAAFASYDYGGDGDDLLVGTSNMASTAVAGVTMTFDIFRGGSTTAAHRKALEDQKIAELTFQKVDKGLALDLESTLTEYRSLIRIYEANLNTLRLANKSYTISLSRYASGSGSQMELSGSEGALTQTKLGVLETLFKINLAKAKIEKLTSGENYL